MMFAILGFYKFKKISNLNTKKKLLEKLFKIEKIRGSITLSNEGINSTISFNNNQYDLINNHLKKILSIKKFDNENLSFCKFQAFHKGKIKIKKELVPIGIKLNKRILNNRIEPNKWNELITKKNTILIDTRKNFEYRVGTFKGSLNPKIKNFRDFPKFFKTLKKDNNIAMFCTGGIRCEKASFYLRRIGFKNVYQLNGGIINYLNKIDRKKSMWKGDCFVFDNRVSVKHGLMVGNLKICPGCREPISSLEIKSNKYEEGVSCPNCFSLLSDDQKKRFRMRQQQIQTQKKSDKKYFYRREFK